MPKPPYPTKAVSDRGRRCSTAGEGRRMTSAIKKRQLEASRPGPGGTVPWTLGCLGALVSLGGGGEMALFILLSFCLILEVHPQNVPQPWLKVSPAEGGSVQLDCKTWYSDVQCYYYPEGADTNVKLSSSCRLTLTGADLTSWTGRSYRPPDPVSVKCYYSVRVSGRTIPSPHSPPAPVMILDAPQLEVSPAEGGSVQLDCKAPYAGVSECFFYPEEDRGNTRPSSSCRLTLTGADLNIWTGHSYRPPEPVSVKCYYSVRVSGRPMPSPHSLPAPVIFLDQKPEMSVHYDGQYDVTAECEIPLSGSAGAGVGCNLYTGPRLYLKSESRRGRSGIWSCRFTASKTDLLNRLQSVRSRVVSCDYSLPSHPSTRSPQSLTYDITKLLPPSFQPSVTEEESTAASPASSTRSITPTPPTTRSPGDPTSASVIEIPTIVTFNSATCIIQFSFYDPLQT
ncbi:hypothetical protein NFI96_029845, partial [Prochilodus magdalenae]